MSKDKLEAKKRLINKRKMAQEDSICLAEAERIIEVGFLVVFEALQEEDLDMEELKVKIAHQFKELVLVSPNAITEKGIRFKVPYCKGVSRKKTWSFVKKLAPEYGFECNDSMAIMRISE